MADRPSPLEDALHVTVGLAVLGYNRLQVARRHVEEWLDDLAGELGGQDGHPPGAG